MTQTVIDHIVDNGSSSSFSAKMRLKRFNVFVEYLGVSKDTKILDVGGTIETWIHTDFQSNVTLLNLSFPKQLESSGNIRCVRGDALDMQMFEDKSFDIVYSNSVIEHVGSFENQRKFANEVQRVGKSYWVQTPNKYFPIEPHYLFPFFQFLPGNLQRYIAIKWKYSHLKKWNIDDKRIRKELSLTRLLDRTELLTIFEEASLYTETFMGLTKSIVAYNK